MTNYTHILSIIVWDSQTQYKIDNNNLLDYIKGLFIKKEQVYNGLKIIWHIKELTSLEKAFNKGDIVIDSPFSSDELLLTLTRAAFIDINSYLHEKNLMSKELIATFTITKPLTRRTSLVETAYCIDDLSNT